MIKIPFIWLKEKILIKDMSIETFSETLNERGLENSLHFFKNLQFINFEPSFNRKDLNCWYSIVREISNLLALSIITDINVNFSDKSIHLISERIIIKDSLLMVSLEANGISDYKLESILVIQNNFKISSLELIDNILFSFFDKRLEKYLTLSDRVFEYKIVKNNRRIRLNFYYFCNLVKLNKNKLKNLSSIALKQINFYFIDKNSYFLVEIPRFRKDIISIDNLIEEIIKVACIYKEIESKEIFIIRKIKKDNLTIIRDCMIFIGFNEIISPSLISEREKDWERENINKKFEHLEIANKKNDYNAFYRYSLINYHLKHFKKERRKIFEISEIYYLNNGNLESNEVLSFVCEKSISEDILYSTKVILFTIFSSISLRDKLFLSPIESKILIIVEKKIVGFIILIENIIFVEISLKEIFLFKNTLNKKISDISPFPINRRNISLLVNNDFDLREIQDLIKILLPNELDRVFIKDVYQINEKKLISINFEIIFQSYEKTISRKEIEIYMNNIYREIKNKFKVEIR